MVPVKICTMIADGILILNSYDCFTVLLLYLSSAATLSSLLLPTRLKHLKMSISYGTLYI